MTEREKEIYWQGYNDALVSKRDSGLHLTLTKQKKIEAIVCDYFEVTISQLQTADRRREICYPRQVLAYLLSKKTTMGCVAVSKLLKKHHTSILNAVRAINSLLFYAEEVQKDIATLETRINAEMEIMIPLKIVKAEPVVEESKVTFFHRPPAEYSNSSPYGIASSN